MPLCNGRERAAAVKYDMYDRCYTPRIPRMPVRERGRFGRVPAAAVTQEGRPTASPAVARPPAVHPDGAGPRGMLLQCVYSFKDEKCLKVNVCNASTFATSHSSPKAGVLIWSLERK